MADAAARDARPSIRVRAERQGRDVELRALLRHPMTLARRDRLGFELEPGHYIEEVVIAVDGRIAWRCALSTGVSRNPYLVVGLHDVPIGATVALSWRDNRGASDALTIRLDG